MAASSLLAITLVPVLMTLFIRGRRLRPESENPVSRSSSAIYEPVLRLALRFRRTALAVNFLVVPATVLLLILFPIGSEFMPPLYEGTLFYMPVTPPGALGDRGRHGFCPCRTGSSRASPRWSRCSARPAGPRPPPTRRPSAMMETIVQLKPQDQWRKVHATTTGCRSACAAGGPSVRRRPAVTLRSSSRTWTAACSSRGAERLDHADPRRASTCSRTGIRTPVGRQDRSGADLGTIQEIGTRIEAVLKEVPGTRSSVYAEQVTGGYFTRHHVRRDAIARYGLTVGDVQDVIQTALGGMNVTRTVEGRERYPVNVRYLREYRDDMDKIRRILVPVRTRRRLGKTATAAAGDGPRPARPAGRHRARRPGRP